MSTAGGGAGSQHCFETNCLGAIVSTLCARTSISAKPDDATAVESSYGRLQHQRPDRQLSATGTSTQVIGRIQMRRNSSSC